MVFISEFELDITIWKMENFDIVNYIEIEPALPYWYAYDLVMLLTKLKVVSVVIVTYQ